MQVRVGNKKAGLSKIKKLHENGNKIVIVMDLLLEGNKSGRYIFPPSSRRFLFVFMLIMIFFNLLYSYSGGLHSL